MEEALLRGANLTDLDRLSSSQAQAQAQAPREGSADRRMSGEGVAFGAGGACSLAFLTIIGTLETVIEGVNEVVGRAVAEGEGRGYEISGASCASGLKVGGRAGGAAEAAKFINRKMLRRASSEG